MPVDNAVEFKNILFTYPDTEKAVLDKISFKIKKGSWTSLIGHNGSGKSTISKLINGLLLPDSIADSKINVLGMELNQETVWKIRKKLVLYFKIQITNLLEQQLGMMLLLVLKIELFHETGW